MHMFDHAAIFVFKSDDEDGVLEALMEADVDVSDIEAEDGMLSVFAPNTDFFKAKQALNSFGIEEFEVEEIQFLAQSTAPIAEDANEKFERFMDMLNDLDDVQRVYHNVA